VIGAVNLDSDGGDNPAAGQRERFLGLPHFTTRALRRNAGKSPQCDPEFKTEAARRILPDDLLTTE